MALIDRVKGIYNNIPLEALNMCAPFFYAIPVSIRYGHVFDNQRKILASQEKISNTEVEELINKKFLFLVKHCYENVPYYNRLFKEYGLNIESFQDVRDITKIPFLTKNILVEHRDELLADNINKDNLQYITTSGSTGNPVGFFVDQDSTMKEWAYTLHIWKRVGYKPDSSRLVLRGKVFREQKNGKNWQFDALKRELSCNIFDMTDENMEQYCNAIEKYKPEFIHGYMSAIVILCKYIDRRHYELANKFKAILAVSESVLDYQRDYVEKVLKCRVFSFYGHSERLIIAGECEYSNEYHIEPSYGYAEIIDQNEHVIKDDSAGELVATGFCNKGMPMLRYKTGDIANWSIRKNCECGRQTVRLMGVSGRWKQDILVNKFGALVSITAINIHSDIFDRIENYQFYQDTIGQVVMKIIPGNEFNSNDINGIIKMLSEKTQNKIDFNVILVADIVRKKNGKYTIVDQQLKNIFV